MFINKKLLILIILFTIIVSLVSFLTKINWFENRTKESAQEIVNLDKEKTEIIKYQQFYIPKESRNGYCWTTSIAAPANDMAWRCTTEQDEIFDPCFETKSSQIVCRVDPEKLDSGFELKLEKPLPEVDRNPILSNSNLPWLVRLKNGITCMAMTGTAGYIDGERYYYWCNDNAVLLNNKSEGVQEAKSGTFDTSGNIWKVKVAFLDDKMEKINKIEELEVYKVWQ
jgi:hypothetical protein